MEQIEVKDNSYIPLLIALVRNLIIAVAGTTTYVSDDTATKIASSVVTLAAIVWGMVRAYRTNEQKKVMEQFVPDSVAVRK